MKKSELKQLIKEELGTIREAKGPNFKAGYQPNSLVAVVYFNYPKMSNNTSALWGDIINVIEEAECHLIKYVVTAGVCEFNFEPNAPTPDTIDLAKQDVEDGIKTSGASDWYVYIVE